VITFSANDFARVSTLTTTQAIIFLQLQGKLLLVQTLVTGLRTGKDQPKLEKHLAIGCSFPLAGSERRYTSVQRD
jgi:hypothetical protein